MISLKSQVSSFKFKHALGALLTPNFKLQTSNLRLRARGVTLIEMIVVIVITGIIAAAVAVFIRRPVEGYIDSARRAELTDVADTALRRITRDLRTALPNSIRIVASGGVTYLEFLQTSGGGRYRADVDSGGGGDVLDFTAADSSFDVIGAMPAFAGGESVVIYNLNSDPTITTLNAYAGDNRATHASNTATTINLTAAKLFPFSSPGKRFHVVQYPVTYACNPGARELRRYWGYAISTPQPTPPATPNNVLLAQQVNGCEFSYTVSPTNQRTGVVGLRLELTQSGQTVRLFQQVHVSNVP